MTRYRIFTPAAEVVTPPATDYTGFTQVLNDQFATLDSTKYYLVDNDGSFGHEAANLRIQFYRAQNVDVGTGSSAGATGNTSLRMFSRREDITYGGTTYNFTAGMIDTKRANTYYPRYGIYEFRCKIPHGQGIWPSIWLTAKNGGATTAELDIMEYFHSQLPGKNSTTLFSVDNTGVSTTSTTRFTNNGNAANNGWGRTFFEAPTYTPGWVKFRAQITPVTDATGNTYGDPAAPSEYVRFKIWVNDVLAFDKTQNICTWWTSNGGTEDSFWNIYLNGSQISGKFVGHPDDPLGYSRQLGGCVNGGTAPNSCTIVQGGYTVQRAQFTDPASTLEVDYMKVYKFIGGI